MKGESISLGQARAVHDLGAQLIGMKDEGRTGPLRGSSYTRTTRWVQEFLLTHEI